MGKMKEMLAEMVAESKEAMECYPQDTIEVTWLDAVPFDKDGKPTGEKNEWVINCGEYVIADGFETEKEASEMLEILLGELELENEEDHLEVNDNGSLLNKDVVTYCNSCQEDVHKEVDTCPTCGSRDVEHIRE